MDRKKLVSSLKSWHTTIVGLMTFISTLLFSVIAIAEGNAEEVDIQAVINSLGAALASLGVGAGALGALSKDGSKSSKELDLE